MSVRYLPGFQSAICIHKRVLIKCKFLINWQTLCIGGSMAERSTVSKSSITGGHTGELLKKIICMKKKTRNASLYSTRKNIWNLTWQRVVDFFLIYLHSSCRSYHFSPSDASFQLRNALKIVCQFSLNRYILKMQPKWKLASKFPLKYMIQ